MQPVDRERFGSPRQRRRVRIEVGFFSLVTASSGARRGVDFERFLTAGWRVRATQHSVSVRESAARSSLWMSNHLREKPFPEREGSRQENGSAE